VKIEQQTQWGIEQATDTYGIKNWGNGYFDISDEGDVVINNPKDPSSVGLSLMDVIQGLRDRDLHMPASHLLFVAYYTITFPTQNIGCSSRLSLLLFLPIPGIHIQKILSSMKFLNCSLAI